MTIEAAFEIEFGDCDPAGIVFYPRFFRWFDATYHRWLRQHDVDHQRLIEELGCVGTGLMDAGARFVSPARPGDTLTLVGQLESATNKSFRMSYTGYIKDRICLQGHEVRGLFVLNNDQIQAAPLQSLWQILDISPPQSQLKPSQN